MKSKAFCVKFSKCFLCLFRFMMGSCLAKGDIGTKMF